MDEKPRSTAVRAALLAAQLRTARREQEAAEAALQEVQTRGETLEAAATEADALDPEAREAIEGEVDHFEADLAAAEAAVQEKRAAVEDLERRQKETESKANSLRAAQPTGGGGAETTRQRGDDKMGSSDGRAGGAMREIVERTFRGMTAPEREALCQRDDVRGFVDRVRVVLGGDTRAITNVGLTIPDVLLGVIRANIYGYSKMLKHVRRFDVKGDTRQIISSIPVEAVWTECCAKINELTHAFYQEEFTCYKVGGYFAVCNASLEDSAVDLTALIVAGLSEGIGLALDKAILYGRNAATTMKMPMGIVTRLVQDTAPSASDAERPWVDLHTQNVISVSSSVHGADLFRQIVLAAGKAANRYSTGEKTWLMNEATYYSLMAEAMSFTAQGAVVSGMGKTMPVVGGTVETLEFLPDNVIIGGYFGMYTLVQLAGVEFATSEHVLFLEDNTVFRATARYDGGPSIPEAFVAIGIGGTTPTATMTFSPDTANPEPEPDPDPDNGGGDGQT